jgi:hypothetical protein
MQNTFENHNSSHFWNREAHTTHRRFALPFRGDRLPFEKANATKSFQVNGQNVCQSAALNSQLF